jgi:hypothetical protein
MYDRYHPYYKYEGNTNIYYILKSRLFNVGWSMALLGGRKKPRILDSASSVFLECPGAASLLAKRRSSHTQGTSQTNCLRAEGLLYSGALVLHTGKAKAPGHSPESTPVICVDVNQ